jgi:cysteine desulfurase
MDRPIYLDYNATTPLAPDVVAVMRGLLESPFGNPSSSHWAGSPARETVERARAEVADLLNAAADEVVFTSGGSEANNTALKGAFFAFGESGSHVVTTAVEHPAVLEPCRYLERFGAEVTVLPVDSHGRVDPSDLHRAMTSRTVLVSIMHANNEVGTIQPIAECGAIVRDHGALLHVDAAQSIGKIPVDVQALGVDLLSLAGHKFYAPKGIGALYIRRGTKLHPLIHGAGHELGRRAGTESALLTAALGRAAALARDLLPLQEVRALRDRFWDLLKQRFGERVVLNGHPEHRLPNTLNVSFVGRVGADILAAMPQVAASTGSACHSRRVELSPVLEAMGVAPEVGMGAIRFSLGRSTTSQDVDAVVSALTGTLASTGLSAK